MRSSSRSLAEYSRPTFAIGFPLIFTTSAVKSKLPRMKADPTPYASTGTPSASNPEIFSALKPPDATMRTLLKPASLSASRTLRTSCGVTPLARSSELFSREASSIRSDVSSLTAHSLSPSDLATSSEVRRSRFQSRRAPLEVYPGRFLQNVE